MNSATTVRLYSVTDVDLMTGEHEVVSITSDAPPPAAPVVLDVGRRVFVCDARPGDTLEVQISGSLVQVSSNDGPRTTNIYLTRVAAYELGAALFALADTLRS